MIRTIGKCAIVIAMAATILAGCGSSLRPMQVRRLPPATGAPAPIVTTSADGLEVYWWITDDTDGAVGAALAAFVEPPEPASEPIRARWNANGLRMVRLPAEQFSDLERLLPVLHSRRKLWVGWVTSWTEIFRGRRAGGPSPIIIDGQRSSLPAGTLRFIVRCWPAPAEPTGDRVWGDRPLVRLELACQLDIQETVGAAEVFSEPQVASVVDQGPVLRQLTLEALLDPRFVYVLTSEAPGVTWTSRESRMGAVAPSASALPPPDGADAARSEDLAQAEPHDPISFEALGPPVSSPLTVGQAMLSATQSETSWRDARVVVVLIPRSPNRFQLLP